jgi:hypothetical protein
MWEIALPMHFQLPHKGDICATSLRQKHGCHKCATYKNLWIPNSTPQNGSIFFKPILVTYRSTPIHWWLKYIGDIFYSSLLVMRKDALFLIHITHYVSLSFNFEICLDILLLIIYFLNCVSHGL